MNRIVFDSLSYIELFTAVKLGPSVNDVTKHLYFSMDFWKSVANKSFPTLGTGTTNNRGIDVSSLSNKIFVIQVDITNIDAAPDKLELVYTYISRETLTSTRYYPMTVDLTNDYSRSKGSFFTVISADKITKLDRLTYNANKSAASPLPTTDISARIIAI